MQNFVIAKTPKTPKIIMDADKGQIEFKGSSIMENSRSYFEPVFKWINEYVQEPKDTVIHFDFEYFNSSSAKAILTVFKSLLLVKDAGFKLKVEWCYAKDDEDMKESGMNFASVIEAEFEFIEK